MILRNLLYAAVLTLLLPFQIFAWGRQGHQIVAQLAMHQLNDATRDKVLRVFGNMAPDQAAAYIGQAATVCGKVYGTKFLKNVPTFLNIGNDYPNHPFTAVITFKNRSGFTYKPEEYLNGKTICLTGNVKVYKGKPEIIVDKEGQIKVQ